MKKNCFRFEIYLAKCIESHQKFRDNHQTEKDQF